MDSLNKIFDKFRNIQISCKGEDVNWEEKYKELKELYREVSSLTFKYTKKVHFYYYIHQKLITDIAEEMQAAKAKIS